MDTSVGRRCSTIVGDGFVGRICVFVVWRWGTNLSRTVVSSCLAQGYPELLVVVVCIVCAGWGHRSLLYSFAFVSLAVGGFLIFLESHAPFLLISFLGLLKSAWSWQGGGQHCWARAISGGLRLAMVRRISLVSCFFICCSWPLGHREA